MPSTLKNNAYHVLGLDVSASQKDILKRSKEIINRLRSEDDPNYDLDIGLYDDFRNEESVKDALQRLQAPKKRIKEYFFWFQIADSVDEKALEMLKRKKYSDAISIWKKASAGQSTKASFYKKNLAILYCVILSVDDDKDYLKDSIITWKELVDSDKFWSAFSKIYKLHDEQTASEDIISDLKKHVEGYLSDIYTELHQIHNDDNYLNEFQNAFSVKGEKIEKSVLAPAYKAINQAVEELESLEVSKDSKFDEEESQKIKKLVAKIQQELNRLIDLGLFDDSQTKIMRDRSANALRSISIDLHNNLSELEKARGLLEVAIKLAGTESLKGKLKGELAQIEKNIDGQADSNLVLEVPGIIGGGNILFTNTYLEYNNKKVFYKDAKRLAYHANSTSINLIPVSQSFNFMVASDHETISINLGTSLYIGHKAKQQLWAKLIGISEALIEPHIVRGLVDRIFKHGETVTIGEVEFSKLGYSRNKTKWFGKAEKETVYWTDTVYIPKFNAGQVILWKDKDGKSQQFASIAMSTSNAVVIPELIKACVNYS